MRNIAKFFSYFANFFLQNFTYFPKKKCKIHKEMSQYCAIFSQSELFFAKQIIVKFRERNAKNVKIKMFFPTDAILVIIGSNGS